MTSHSWKKGLALAMAPVVLVGLAAWSAASPRTAEAAAAKKKMAMILPGSIQDADFNALGYVALQEVVKAYALQVSHSESVAVADAERISREYINAGYDIVAYHGGQFPTIMAKLAPQFPRVVFIQETSGRLPNQPPNAWNIARRWYQGFYVLGALAALSTRTNKVGFIGGVRIPDVVASTNAVQQALKDYNPKAQLIYNYIGDFNDPLKARQTAEAQIAAGVDFMVNFVNLGIYGLGEAVKATPKPVLFTTFMTEKWDLAPKHLTASLVADFASSYKAVVGRIVNGETSGYYEMRPGNGIEISDLRNVPPEVAAKVREIYRQVVAGKPIPEVTDKVLSP